MSDGLALDDARPALSTCRELVSVDLWRCTTCGGPTFVEHVVEMALFFHGGYGADRQTTWAHCADRECNMVRLVAVAETNPRRRS